jgi:hypothetical protein
MHVIFIHGPAAAGKYTIGSALAARRGLPLFHNHLAVDLAISLFPFGSPGFRRVRAVAWHAAFEEAAASGTSFVFTFQPEATVAPDLVEQLVACVERTGGRVYSIALTCAREVVASRLGESSRQRFGKLTDPALYARIERDGGFEFRPLPRPLVTIDTGATSVEGSVALIDAALNGVIAKPD